MGEQPWQAQGRSPAQPADPGRVPGGEQIRPQQGQPWGQPTQASSPAQEPPAAQTMRIAPVSPGGRSGQPPAGPAAAPHAPGARHPGQPGQQGWGGGPLGPAGAADETQVIAQFPPGGLGGQQADGGEETRQLPRIPEGLGQPPLSSPSSAAPDWQRGQGAAPGYSGPSADPAQTGYPAGVPGGPRPYSPHIPDAGSDEGESTRVLPMVTDPPGVAGGSPGGFADSGYSGYRPANASGRTVPPAPGARGGRSHGAPQGQGLPGNGGPSGLSAIRKLSPKALAGVVVGGCAVAGLVAGAALSFGADDGGDQPDPRRQNAAATSGVTPSKSAAPDPGADQAKALDALLKDSNSSRSAVVNAVAQIKVCQNLGPAAQSLNAAANQRSNLVNQLGKLSLAAVSNHEALAASLKQAWNASASADRHYAVWAMEVSRKNCVKGRARHTGHAQLGDRASGEATQAKNQAASLWNAVAKHYGLTERQATEL